MDNNVTAAVRHFEAQEASHERACYCAASAHGLTGEQADQCDDGDKGCPACPFPRLTTDALLRARGLPALAYVNNYDKSPGAPRVICVKRGEAGYFGVGVTPDQGDGRPDTSVQDARDRREARDRVRDGALRSLRDAVSSAEQQSAVQTLATLRQVLWMVERRHAGPAAARRAAERADAMIAAELRNEAGNAQTSFIFS